MMRYNFYRLSFTCFHIIKTVTSSCRKHIYLCMCVVVVFQFLPFLLFFFFFFFFCFVVVVLFCFVFICLFCFVFSKYMKLYMYTTFSFSHPEQFIFLSKKL